MHIGKSELISFKIAINEAAETYGLTPSAAALDVINLIIDHNKKGQLKRELSELNFKKYAQSILLKPQPSYNGFSQSAKPSDKR